jgi:nucleoside-diphosphate-sugar epimerase
MNQARIIITGASGFIGTNLLEKFVNAGYLVQNIDIVRPRNHTYDVFWKKIDITKFNDLNEIITQFSPDYIIHLAARTDLNGKSIDDYSANTIGVSNVLEISKNVKNLKKLVIASSMLVCSLGYKQKDIFDYHPTTIYGESKVITEQTIWNNRPNCDWAIIRPTSIWGEWFGEPYKNFFDMIIRRRYFHIGKKSCTKTYGYVGNAVYQIEKILFSDTSEDNNKVFYIGDIPPVNIEEWANEIANLLKYKILKVPYGIVYIAAIFGDVLKKIKVSFPMTTFRFQNMTTDNIIDLSKTNIIAPDLPYSRIQGIKKTLEWINSNT